jgi:hypothetical protein
LFLGFGFDVLGAWDELEETGIDWAFFYLEKL